jgi:hypothetical protein
MVKFVASERRMRTMLENRAVQRRQWGGRPRWVLCALLLIVGLAASAPSTPASAEATVIGDVTRLKPEVGARLQGEVRALAVGAQVHRDEQVWTSRGARLDIKFTDGSTVVLGENARLVLDKFVLPESEGSGTQVLRSISGALRFLGGAVDRSGRGATRIITPMAIVTVRGTDFFAGPIDGAYGVFVFEGAVEVANGGGSVTLRAGEGTTLTRSSVAPTPPIVWGAAKIARAERLVGY